MEPLVSIYCVKVIAFDQLLEFPSICLFHFVLQVCCATVFLRPIYTVW